MTGKDLIAMGYKPDKWFGEVLEKLNNTEDSLTEKQIKDFIEAHIPKTIELRNRPVVAERYLTVKEPEDVENLEKVLSTLHEIGRLPTVLNLGVMPDACPTGPNSMPVGTYALTYDTIHPGFHSADVCCSVMATNLGKVDPKEVLEVARSVTHFGPGKNPRSFWWSTLLYDSPLANKISENYFTKDYIEKAATHLGTQGDGNHFLFVGSSESTNDTWVITHHGSRGFGASVYKKALHEAQRETKLICPTANPAYAWLNYNEELGYTYWEALQIIREWTKLNHNSIHQRIANKLKVSVVDNFWNEHNFVFKSPEGFYHAKGATPIENSFLPDNYCGRKIIPLNMNESVLFVTNKKDSNVKFVPHGAGRNYSRSKHLNQLGKRTHDQIMKEVEGIEVIFYSGVPDYTELPSAYKSADFIKEQIKLHNLCFIQDEIIPYGSIMAGRYKKSY